MAEEKPKCWSADQVNNGIACASPPTGLNNNLEFMGKLLHVQTENVEFPMARIVTQVFCGGRVVLSKKTEYPPGIRESKDFRKIHQLMRMQHFKIIQEITDKQTRILGSH